MGEFNQGPGRHHFFDASEWREEPEWAHSVHNKGDGVLHMPAHLLTTPGANWGTWIATGLLVGVVALVTLQYLGCCKP